MYFRVGLCIVCFVAYPVLFVCICVLNNCHRVATQLQLNISYIPNTPSGCLAARARVWYCLDSVSSQMM
jgi:hypothetical protein